MCIKNGNIYQNGHFPLKVLNEITKFSIAAHLYVTVAIFHHIMLLHLLSVLDP